MIRNVTIQHGHVQGTSPMLRTHYFPQPVLHLQCVAYACRLVLPFFLSFFLPFSFSVSIVLFWVVWTRGPDWADADPLWDKRTQQLFPAALSPHWQCSSGRPPHLPATLSPIFSIKQKDPYCLTITSYGPDPRETPPPANVPQGWCWPRPLTSGAERKTSVLGRGSMTRGRATGSL